MLLTNQNVPWLLSIDATALRSRPSLYANFRHVLTKRGDHGNRICSTRLEGLKQLSSHFDDPPEDMKWLGCCLLIYLPLRSQTYNIQAQNPVVVVFATVPRLPGESSW